MVLSTNTVHPEKNILVNIHGSVEIATNCDQEPVWGKGGDLCGSPVT